MEFIKETQRDFGIRHLKQLNVSGAFHTKLMQNSADEVAKLLEKMTIRRGDVTVYSNLTGKKYPSKPAVMRKFLSRQIVEPVKWEQIIRTVYSRRDEVYPKTYEVGSRRVLGHLLKVTDMKAYSNSSGVEV